MDQLTKYRDLTSDEIKIIEGRGCIAQNWANVKVSCDFAPSQLYSSCFEGEVYINSGATISNSTVANYVIDSGAKIDSVVRLECRSRSCFGNGVEVAVVNECGGRSVKLYSKLRAHTAYLWAMWRHRGEFVKRLESLVDDYSAEHASHLGYVGVGSCIIGARIIREVWIEGGVNIEGATLISNATICSGAYVGVDVKLQDFIAIENSRVDTGAILTRSLVGENAIVANGFTAVDSLIFANSHLENGEAASIFAGPYTVSHHKSSLLIAGMFSFFNAGSGANQSNHLFKSGAVHQSIHPRGCKFASGAYIMAPAIEGAYTMVKGHHSQHHDTSMFPFSYLIESNGKSTIMPGANLVSYGTARDIEKWRLRDKRDLKFENISFEEHNPCITEMMVGAVNTIHTLQDENPSAEVYMHGRIQIKPAHLKRALGFYNKAIATSLGHMLSCGKGTTLLCEDEGDSLKWMDCAGQYVTVSMAEKLTQRVESGAIASLDQIDSYFQQFAAKYDSYVYMWAYNLLGELLGHKPTEEDVESAIDGAKKSEESLKRLIESDRLNDCSINMAVGYGLHTDSQEAKINDFKAVRSL